MQVLNKFLWKNSTGNCVEGVVNGRTGNGPVRLTSCEIPYIIHLKLLQGILVP